MEPDELLDQLAAEPLSAASDGQSAQQHSIPDMLDYVRYKKGADAVTTSGTGWAALRIARFKPPGADPE